MFSHIICYGMDFWWTKVFIMGLRVIPRHCKGLSLRKLLFSPRIKRLGLAIGMHFFVWFQNANAFAMADRNRPIHCKKWDATKWVCSLGHLGQVDKFLGSLLCFEALCPCIRAWHSLCICRRHSRLLECIAQLIHVDQRQPACTYVQRILMGLLIA